eukprot:EG_transcript_27220
MGWLSWLWPQKSTEVAVAPAVVEPTEEKPKRRRKRKPRYQVETDFSQLKDTEASEEEKRLKQEWLSASTSFGFTFTAVGFGVGFVAMKALNRGYHGLVAPGFCGAILDWSWAIYRAQPQRERLDDFLIEKKLYYVRTGQADVP